MASSFLSYLGPFNKEFRELLLARDLQGACERLGIPTTTKLSPTQFLVDTSEIGEWTLQVRLPVCMRSAQLSPPPLISAPPSSWWTPPR